MSRAGQSVGIARTRDCGHYRRFWTASQSDEQRVTRRPEVRDSGSILASEILSTERIGAESIVCSFPKVVGGVLELSSEDGTDPTGCRIPR